MFGVKKLKIWHILNASLLFLLVTLFVKASIFKDIIFGGSSTYDFDLYYHLIQAIKNGFNPYTVGITYTLGPPLVFLYFLPFGFFDIDSARIIATLLNIASGFLLCFLLAKRFTPKYKLTGFLFLSLIFYSSFLPRYSLGMGQPSIFVTLLVTLIIVSKNNLSGIIIAAISSLKTFYLLTMLAFIKNKRAIWMLFLSISLLFLVSLLFIKIDWYIYYFKNIFPSLNNFSLPMSGLDYYNQSLRSTLFRLSIENVYPYIYYPILILASLVVIITQNFSLSVISAILLSPISWQHYYVSLFPILVFTFFTIKRDFRNFLLFFVSFFLWWTQFPQLHTLSNNLQNGIAASHFFISGALLYYLNLKIKPQIARK